MVFEMALQLRAAGESVERLTLLDGSHSYVAAHTHKHKEKLQQNSLPQIETEALCAFVLQFIPADYNKVSYHSPGFDPYPLNDHQ